jgi:hypothetical protein
MNDEVKPSPVDNSHRDAGIAARDSQKEPTPAATTDDPKPGKDSPADGKKDEAADAATEQDDSQNSSGDSADPESGDAPAQQSRGKKPGVHQRIDELTALRRDAERERDYWREQAMRQPSQQQPDAPAVESKSDEPTLESCDFDQAEFNRRYYKWAREQERKQEAAQQRQQSFAQKEAAFMAEHPDYAEVTRAPHVPITQMVAEAILETDDPPAVAYYLAKNLEEATAIAQMTPLNAARAIGRIEAKLSAPTPAPEAPRQPEPRTVTKAPPPVTTLSGAPAIRKAYDEMSMAEYDATRRAERKAKGLQP